MNNPLYKQIQQQNQNPMNVFMQKFQQFRQSFSGDPQEQIQKMMNAGKVDCNEWQCKSQGGYKSRCTGIL